MIKLWRFCGFFFHRWEIIDKKILHKFYSLEESYTDHWAEAHNFYDITYKCSVCEKVHLRKNVPSIKRHIRKKTK